MAKKHIREEESFDSKVAAVDEKLKNLNEKLIELNKRISNSRTEATAASSQANKAVGVNPEAQTQDKKMKMAQAAKSIADSRYYQEELKKIKDEISSVNQEKSDLLKNKNTQLV